MLRSVKVCPEVIIIILSPTCITWTLIIMYCACILVLIIQWYFSTLPWKVVISWWLRPTRKKSCFHWFPYFAGIYFFFTKFYFEKIIKNTTFFCACEELCLRWHTNRQLISHSLRKSCVLTACKLFHRVLQEWHKCLLLCITSFFLM